MKGQFRLRALRELLHVHDVLDKDFFDQHTQFRAIPRTGIGRWLRYGMDGPKESKDVRHYHDDIGMLFTAYRDGTGENITVVGGRGLIPQIPMHKKVSVMVAEEHGLVFDPRKGWEDFRAPDGETNDLEAVEKYIHAMRDVEAHLQAISSGTARHIYSMGDEWLRNR
jgi:hypothetical protein